MTIKRTMIALLIAAVGGWTLYVGLSLRTTLNTLPSSQALASAIERTPVQAVDPPLIAGEQGRRESGETAPSPMAPIDPEPSPPEMSGFQLELEQGASGIGVQVEASDVAQTTGKAPSGFGDPESNDLGDSTERPLAWCSPEMLDREVVSDTTTVWSGSRSVRIHAGSAGRNSIWQGLDATPYRGSRMGISVRVKSDGAIGLLLVVARIHESAETGTLPWRAQTISSIEIEPGSATQWSSLSVVGDIPEDVEQIYYAVTLNGAETLWIDSVSVVEMDNPAVTGVLSRPAAVYHRGNPIVVLAAPSNLDFEQTTSDRASDTPESGDAYCHNIQID